MLLSKLIKFVKENLVAVIGIAAIVVSLLLLLISNFVNLNGFGSGIPTIEQFTMNGYEFFFNTKVFNGETIHPGALVGRLPNEAYALPAGIAIIIMFTLTIAALIFNKKTSLLPLLAGGMLVACAIIFFAMEASVQNVYGIILDKGYQGKEDIIPTVNAQSYIIGAILLLAGAYVIYKGVLALKEEIKHPQEQKGTYYSYLKK